MSDSRVTEGLLGRADRRLRPAARSFRPPVPFKLYTPLRTGRGFVQITPFRTVPRPETVRIATPSRSSVPAQYGKTLSS